MYSRNDPRLRRRIDHALAGIESANETARTGLYTFSQRYVEPCFASTANAFHACVAPCFPTQDERRRRARGRSRGRPELNFDFYDDWDDDEDLGWGNDELDRLLAGSGGYGAASNGQPGRQRGMSYGTRRGRERDRRKSVGQGHNDDMEDPNVIPNSSYLGFMSKLPWKIGGKGLRYKPSAADLQEHPGQRRADIEQQQPLIENEDSEDEALRDSVKTHRRERSATSISGHTVDSLSSRGDLFPSEDEDDAIPLDDEFAMVLERRTTGLGDETSSGKTGAKRSSGSRMSLRTTSSQSMRPGRNREASQTQTSIKRAESGIDEEIPTLSDLKQQELQVQKEEDDETERKRIAAQKLAAKRGLASDAPTSPSSDSKLESPPASSPPVVSQINSVLASPTSEITPFPSFDAAVTPDRGRPLSPMSPHSDPATPKPKKRKESTFVPAQLPHFGAESPG
ncbi:hypothetical protein K402DRAFT_392510 [Aulographum hederae CBS 113979]|uniref:Uncharacterized protein n=1 Tax=Aulographum hederae CBS 113979 TaxID=1176131 RepID=A0A6G1H3S4_9PEZI|nr:hypothetical protein K402DRAFT_392510 [Aulographum hederae CBS 113979]